MRNRHQPLQSSPVEVFSEKLKTWNTSLSKIQLRASLVNKAALRPVYETRGARHNYTKSTPTVNEIAKDSVIDLTDLRDRYTCGDRIFGEHEQNTRRHGQGSRDRSRSRVCVSARGSTHSEFDNDAVFLQRIEATRKSQPVPSLPQSDRQPAGKAQSVKHLKSMSRVTLKTEKALPPLPDGELQPHIKKTFIESIRSTRHLRNMKSLTHLKVYTNPHESMDFRCVGSPIEAVIAFENTFEERELQIERDELLRSINLARNRMCEQRIGMLGRSAHLDKQARDAANDLDRFDSVPAGSTVTMDEETATAQLIGPAGYSGLATGERWASVLHQSMAIGGDAEGSRGRHKRQHSQASYKKPVLKLNTEMLTSTKTRYNMFTAITDESWRTIGMARTSVDRRWVVLLSASLAPENDDAKSMRTILTPASSVRAPRSGSRARGLAPRSPQLPLEFSYGHMAPSYSDDDDSVPTTPSLPVTPILGMDGIVGARGGKERQQQPPNLRCHMRNAERLAITYDTLAPDYRNDEDRSPVTPVWAI